MAICLRLLRMGKVGRGVGWGVGRMGLFRSCSSNNVYEERCWEEFRNSEPDRVIRVRNLPLSILGPAVKAVFEQVGEVLMVEIIRRPSGKSLGEALVEYADTKSVSLALANLDNVEIEGRKVNIRKNKTAPREEEAFVSRRIRLSGIPPRLKTSELRNIGEFFGEVVHAKLEIGQDGRAMNVASMMFRKQEAATNARNQLDERMINGKILTVQYCKEEVKRYSGKLPKPR